jgi:hypothetical protein
MSPSPQNNASSGRLRRVLVWLLGIAAGISALFAGLNFLFGPGLIPTIYHHFSTPSVKLEGWPKEIRLNEQATFTVLVDSKDATGHYRCSWTVDGLPTPPDIGGGVRQDDCQPFRVQNLGTNFRPDQDRQTINIGVDVWDSTGRQRLNGAVDNVTLTQQILKLGSRPGPSRSTAPLRLMSRSVVTLCLQRIAACGALPVCSSNRTLTDRTTTARISNSTRPRIWLTRSKEDCSWS